MVIERIGSRQINIRIAHLLPPVPWTTSLNRRPRALFLGSGDRPNLRAEAARLRPRSISMSMSSLKIFNTSKTFGIDADVVIVLGGDGSILRAALQMQEQPDSDFGVNLGKLGFLASVSARRFAAQSPARCGSR